MILATKALRHEVNCYWKILDSRSPIGVEDKLRGNDMLNFSWELCCE